MPPSGGSKLQSLLALSTVTFTAPTIASRSFCAIHLQVFEPSSSPAADAPSSSAFFFFFLLPPSSVFSALSFSTFSVLSVFSDASSFGFSLQAGTARATKSGRSGSQFRIMSRMARDAAGIVKAGARGRPSRGRSSPRSRVRRRSPRPFAPRSPGAAAARTPARAASSSMIRASLRAIASSHDGFAKSPSSIRLARASIVAPGLKCSNSVAACSGGTRERLGEREHVGEPGGEEHQEQVAEELERRSRLRARPEVHHLAGHRLEPRTNRRDRAQDRRRRASARSQSRAFCGPMNTGACTNRTPRSRHRALRATTELAAVVV